MFLAFFCFRFSTLVHSSPPSGSFPFSGEESTLKEFAFEWSRRGFLFSGPRCDDADPPLVARFISGMA